MVLFESLLDRLSTAEFVVFLVQAWLIWNQRNAIVHRGQIKDPKWLNQRAVEYLDEYRKVQEQMILPSTAAQPRQSWQPPPSSVYKLNFDEAVFTGIQCSGFGAIIRNSYGEVMAAMSVKGPSVSSSEEVKALACQKAIEFAMEAGFSELIIEGDNTAAMKAVAGSSGGNSLLGHVYEDIHCSLLGLHSVSISCVRRGGYKVAHILALINITDELYWMEDSPPVLEALYQDCLNINE